MVSTVLEVYLTENQSVFLKPLTIAHASELFRLINSHREHLSQFGDNTAAKYPDKTAVVRSFTNPEPGKIRFGIWYQGKLCGTINLKPTSSSFNEHEIGYWVASQWTRRKIATTAVRALTSHFYTTFGRWGFILARTHKGNIASQTVLHGAGFIPIGKSGNDLWFSFNRN